MVVALLIFAGLWAVLIVGIVAFFMGATSLPTPKPLAELSADKEAA